MRNKVNLYIAGQLADISSDALVLMNYRAEDLQNPVIVKNSYSQSLTLPGSPQNNAIFGHVARSDHHSGTGGAGVAFSALKKTDFQIIAEDGQLLESGYIKLETIERKADAVNYKITLFGGLGAFLYGLMYDADGNKRSLADLNFGTSLDFVINRDSVREAWRQQAGVERTSDRWDVINFAPCYNGVPGGGFQANKAFISTECAGVQSSDATGATAKRGHVLASLTQNYDEWQTKDLRSYLQRPVIKIGAVIDAICDTLNNGGYNVTLDPIFFSSGNPYYSKTWLTLPTLSDLQIQPTAGEDSTPVTAHNAGLENELLIDIPIVGNTAISTEFTASVSFTPQLTLPNSHTGRVYAAWERPDQPTGRIATRFGCLYQLLAYDSNGKVIGGSKIAMATTYSKNVSGTQSLPREYTPSEFVRLWNNDNSYPMPDYVPAWAESGYEANAMAGDGYDFNGGTVGVLTLSDIEQRMTLTLSARGVARMALRITTLGATQTLDNYLFRYYTPQMIDSNNNAITFSGMGNGVSALQYTYESNGVIRSGSTVTGRQLLGGTASPADYLLGLVKMFGLHLDYDGRTKTISILTRNSYYNNTAPIDLTDVIERQSVTITPYILDARWYLFGNDVAEGAFVKYYEAINANRYGVQRVNTGFEFNADSKNLLNGVIYRTAAETLAQGKYYVNMAVSGRDYPAPLLDGGTYLLWDANNETRSFDIIQPGDTASVQYINEQHRGYDYPFASKIQLADADGKPTDGENILLFFDYSLSTVYYRGYCLTDDNDLMALYNGGEACWLLGQSSIEANAPYCIGEDLPMPIFRRYKTVREGDRRKATHSLDMGTPRELGVYSVLLDDTTSIYRKAWHRYITDRYDVDSRVMSCKANIRALGQVGGQMLRRFYYYDGALWVMNSIKNHSLSTEHLTEVEFVKVKDVTSYASGQNFLLPVLTVQEEYTAPRLGETATFAINASLIDTATLTVTAPEWVTASISGTTLTLTTGSNPTTAERSGLVIISGKSVEGQILTAQMQVQQIGAYALSITPTSYTIGSEDYDVYRYNIEYEGTDILTAKSSAAWLDVAIVQNKYLDASANERNTTGANRTAVITVTGSGVSKQVRITQQRGNHISQYEVQLNYNSMQVYPRNENTNYAWIIEGDREMLETESMGVRILLQTSSNDVPRPTSVYCTINGGSSTGTVFSFVYDSSPAPRNFFYICAPIPLRQIFNNTDSARLIISASGATLTNNILNLDFFPNS